MHEIERLISRLRSVLQGTSSISKVKPVECLAQGVHTLFLLYSDEYFPRVFYKALHETRGSEEPRGLQRPP